VRIKDPVFSAAGGRSTNDPNNSISHSLLVDAVRYKAVACPPKCRKTGLRRKNRILQSIPYMMEQKDIRWVQRFSNYKKALAKLAQVAGRANVNALSDLEKEGMIQRFEYTFELAWKTLQDLLEYKGYIDIVGPNPVLEQSLKDGYISDEKLWRNMKRSRELTSHTYNSDTADEIAVNIVETYFQLLSDLQQTLENEAGSHQTNIFN
jgi:nucleotidyltransferase substrate binding protein (TIGR01987 family)